MQGKIDGETGKKMETYALGKMDRDALGKMNAGMAMEMAWRG
jgi:hypothetical protein